MGSSRHQVPGGNTPAENLALFGTLAALGTALATVDKFGLPLKWQLSGETPEQRLERVVAVIGVVREVYFTAISHLGIDPARAVWKETAKGKAGRPKGRRNPQLDDVMLQVYDSFITSEPKKNKSAPREASNSLKRVAPDLFPATVGSLEQHLRRLIKDRNRDRAESSEANRRLAIAMLSDVPLSRALIEALKPASLPE